MKRKRVLWGSLAAFAVLIVCAAAIVFFTPGESLPVPAASNILLEKTAHLPHTTLHVTADDSLTLLTCRQETHFTNETAQPLDRVLLRLYPNVYKRASTTPLTSDTVSLGETFVTSVCIDGQPAAWAIAASDETVLDVPVTLAPGDACTIALDYTLSVPDAAGRLGAANDVTLFGNAFAQIAPYEDGRFRDDAYSAIGDPFYAQSLNATLHLTLPAGCTAAVSGALRAQEGNTLTYECLGVRDVSFALSRKFHTAQTQRDGTLVTVHARSRANAQKTLKIALSVLDIYEALFEYAYPYPTLTLAQGDLGPYGGMEYSTYAVIGDAAYQTGGDSLELIIAHEIAHQWFGALVGSDQITAPWLDEAMSEYASMLYFEKAHGQRAFDALYAQKIEPALRLTRPFGVTTGAPLDVFMSVNEYAQVVYQRGAGMLHGIREAIGLEAFCEFVHAYVHRYAFDIATREDFATLLREITGSDWIGYLNDYLDS